MRRKWKVIHTEQDARQFAGKIVIFETNLSLFGMPADGVTCLWSPTLEDKPENCMFFGFVVARANNPLVLTTLLKPDEKNTWRELSTANIKAQAGNANNYKDGKKPFIRMRLATDAEIAVASAAVKTGAARPEYCDGNFCRALGLG